MKKSRTKKSAPRGTDSDNPPSTKKELVQVATIVRRGRPSMKAGERKIQVALRLPPDVVKYFRGFGPGWQSRIGAALADYVKRRKAR